MWEVDYLLLITSKPMYCNLYRVTHFDKDISGGRNFPPYENYVILCRKEYESNDINS